MTLEARTNDTAAVASVSDGWAERCGYWLDKHDRAQPKRLRRDRCTTSLVLVGEGMSIRVDKGALLIRDGNTHFPAEKRTHRFFKGALDLPPRIVVIDGSGEISFDAIDWLRVQGVALIRLTWDGEVASVMSSTGFAADPERVEWQRKTRDDPKAALAFARDLISRKLAASLDTIRNHLPHSRFIERAMRVAEEASSDLANNRAKSKLDVLGLEGRAAAAYFYAWRGIEVKWKGIGQKPIPDEWTRFFSRSSLNTGLKPENRNASHPINAILNYAYGVLEARLRVQVIADGCDPTIGIVHNSNRGSSAYVLDLMEPERPRIDAAVLDLVQETTFSPADFTLRDDGVVRLNPEMARQVVQLINLE